MKKVTIKLLSIISIFMCAIALTSCLDEGSVLEFVKLPKAVYFLDEAHPELNKINDNEITIRIGNQGNPVEKTLADLRNDKTFGIIVKGDTFDSEGQHTLYIKYDSLSISFTYNVVKSVEPKPDETIDIEWAGTGEESNPYKITSEKELRGLAAVVNGKAGPAAENIAGQPHFENKHFELTADIELTLPWEPIGEGFRKAYWKNAKYFSGSFNGNNHIISKLTNVGYNPAFAAADYENSSHQKVEKGYVYGLFGLVYGATIKNVRVSEVNIEPLVIISSDGVEAYALDSGAAIVGYALSSDRNIKSQKEWEGFVNKPILIENCHCLSGKILGFDGVAGIFGRNYVYGEVKNCTNYAYVETFRQSGGKAGGIVGISAPVYTTSDGSTPVLSKVAKYSGCTNYGTVVNKYCAAAGGIIGQIGSTIEAVDCVNNGQVLANLSGQVVTVNCGFFFTADDLKPSTLTNVTSSNGCVGVSEEAGVNKKFILPNNSHVAMSTTDYTFIE